MEPYIEEYAHLRQLVRHHTIYSRLPTDAEMENSPGCKAGDNFMSIVRRITVTIHLNEDEHRTVTMIVKRHFRPSLRRQLFRFIDIFLNEINSYNVVLQFLRPYMRRWPSPIIPECYFAGRDHNGGVIILEDLLANGGFTVYSRRNPINLDFAKRAMIHLAKFHAASAIAKAEDPIGFQGILSAAGDEVYCERGAYLYAKLVRTSVAVALSSLINCNVNGKLAEAIKITRRLYGRAYHFMRRCILRAPPDMCVICHGDMWANNIMDNGTELRFLDFQAIRYGSPVFDILHLLFTCGRRPLRASSTRVILETYCNAFADAVKMALPDYSENRLTTILEPFTINRISEEYFRNIAYGLGVAMWVLPAVTFDMNNLPVIKEICDGPETEMEILQVIRSKLTSRYHIRMRETILEFIENGYMQELLHEMQESGDFDIQIPVPLPPDLLENDYLPFSPGSANGHAYALTDDDVTHEEEQTTGERTPAGAGERMDVELPGTSAALTQRANQASREVQPDSIADQATATAAPSTAAAAATTTATATPAEAAATAETQAPEQAQTESAQEVMEGQEEGAQN